VFRLSYFAHSKRMAAAHDSSREEKWAGRFYGWVWISLILAMTPFSAYDPFFCLFTDISYDPFFCLYDHFFCLFTDISYDPFFCLDPLILAMTPFSVSYDPFFCL
jgi:hypothetical protein